MKLVARLLLTVATLIHLSQGTATWPQNPTVTIDSGAIIGTATTFPGGKAPVLKYLGVPFAAKPVRFEPPVKPSKWSTPFDATKYGPACIQQFNFPEAARDVVIEFYNTPPPPAGESEDCLNVNIYVPATRTKAKAVMVWYYGGSLTFGANSLLAYDGTSFAANQDVIVVTVNYRTNIYGFPAAPQLPLTQRNLGFLDQRFALEWVQTNIAAFGGDPEKVLIFGESAGSLSVDSLVTSWKDNPPFRAAIGESGVGSFVAANGPVFSASWANVTKTLGCSTSADVIACMRNIDQATLTNTIEHLEISFGPVADNFTALQFTEPARRSGQIAKVPYLYGTNAQEGRVFAFGITNTTTGIEALFPNFNDATVAAVAAHYPIGSPGTANAFEQSAEIITDYQFQCPAALASNHSVEAHIPTWRYYYNASFPNLAKFPDSGVYHSSEIVIVFGTYPTVNATAEEISLSASLQTIWANFAKNPYAGPGWPMAPQVGVLGTPGAQTVETTIEPIVVDTKCPIYQPIFDALLVED